MKKHVVIVAGGKGSRMKSDIPKQFLLLKDIPVLMHTIEAFHSYDSEIKIIVVLPKEHIEFWEYQIERYSFKIKHTIVHGGTTRYNSVENGLKHAKNGLVAIHDGARPLVNDKIISQSFELAAKLGNAITATNLKDSIRRVENKINYGVDRTEYRIIQTPQTFQTQLIKEAFEKTSDTTAFTDDASVLEYVGGKINLSDGSYENLKITSPEDLQIAEAIMNARK